MCFSKFPPGFKTQSSQNDSIGHSRPILGISVCDPSVSESNQLHVDVFWVWFLFSLHWLYIFSSFSNFDNVWNFHQLLLGLNWFVYNYNKYDCKPRCSVTNTKCYPNNICHSLYIFWGIVDLQYCNCYHLLSDFFILLLIIVDNISSQVAYKRRQGFGQWMNSSIILDNIYSFIHETCHRKNYPSNIKYLMTLNIISSVAVGSSHTLFKTYYYQEL